MELNRIRREVQAPTLLNDVAIIRRTLPAGIVSARGLYAQTFAYIEGAPGLGKTFMMIDLGFQIALGCPWLGAPVERPGPVVGVAAEGAAWVGSRMRAWKQHHGFPLDMPAGLHIWPRAVNLMLEHSVSMFIDAIEAIDPVLIWIDSLSSCMPGGDDGKTGDMSTVIANCDLILQRRPGATLLLLHHPGWDRTRERGASILRDRADTVMSVKPGILRSVKDREGSGFHDVPFKLLEVALDAEGLPSDGRTTCVIERAVTMPTDRSTDDLTTPRRVALDTLRKMVAVSGPPTFGQWFKALPKATVSERRFYDVVDALMKRNLIHKQGQRYEPVIE